MLGTTGWWLLWLGLGAGRGPALVFGPEDLSALRDRVRQPRYATAWQAVLARADAYVDPAARDYADPETIDAGATERPQVIAHTYGRRLTQWVEALGLAWQLTGERRYADHGAAVLAAAARRIPVSDERVAKSFAGARGDIMRGLALGIDWLGDALTDDQRRQVEAVAADYVRNLLAEAGAPGTWWVPHHNFMGVAGGAAGCLALVLRDAYPAEAPGWIDACAALVTRWFDQGFDDDGAYYEGVLYAGYGLSNAVLFAHALARAGGPELLDHPHLRRLPHFLAQSLLPGELVFDARNDSSYAGFAEPALLRLAAAHDSGLAQWLWEQTAGTRAPLAILWDAELPPRDPVAAGEPLASIFRGRGLVVFRTGWGEDDVMFSIEAGPYRKVTHNQADKATFTLYGLGARWAIDSGYGNNRQPGGRDQTVAHNGVLIDGQGQALSGAGAGTDGEIVAFEDRPTHGYVAADATFAYQRNNHDQPGVPLERAIRHALFVKPADGAPAYVVVLDDLRYDDQPHDYTWLLHTADANDVEPLPDGAWISPRGTSGGRFVETPLGAVARGAVEWVVRVEQPGPYALWGSVRASGPELGKADSFVVKVDDGPPAQWHMPTVTQWTWGRVGDGVPATPLTYDLAAGERRIRFETREPGAQVDRLALAPLDAGPPPWGRDAPGIVLWEAESGRVTEPMRVVDAAEPPTPRLRLWLSGAGPVTWQVDRYETHPRLAGTVRAVRPAFAAVLAPLPPGVEPPDVRITHQGDRSTIEVVWPARTDRVTWSGDGAPVYAVE